MPCYSPMTAYRSRQTTASGKRSLVFSPKLGYSDLQVQIACGQCIGCRLERSRQWAVRCMHEASLHQSNSFLTLTYNSEHLPADLSLDVSHWQGFAKRLRFHRGKFRFFHCGEYGSENGRPHYHALIFGLDFPDQKFYKNSGKDQHPIYTSESLDEIWGLGNCYIGSVTFDSAAYVARYVVDKVTGEAAESHYAGRRPEYVTMSRRPGIAFDWYQKHKKSIMRHDSVIANAREMPPPKYYDKLREAEDPKGLELAKKSRIKDAAAHADNNTLDRLAVREQVKLAQVSFLQRN